MNRLVFQIGLFFLLPLVAHADIWTIRADRWCPYNCEPDASDPGYMIEIIDLAAKAGGHSVEYQLIPWSRALKEVRGGNIAIVVGVARDDREGMVLTDKLGTDFSCLFVNEGDSFKYTGVEDLNKLSSIGTSQDYVYVDEFMHWEKANLAKVQPVSGEHTLEINAKKLGLHRIQAFIENALVVAHARKTVTDLKGVVSAGCMADSDLFAGISAKNPKARQIVKSINAKLVELRKSGELKKLLNKYGVSIW